MSDITTDFVKTTKKVVAEVRGVLTALHLIREDVKIIREQVEASGNAQSADQQANESDAKPTEGFALRSDVANNNHTNNEHNERKSKIPKFLQDLNKNFWKDLRKPKTYIEVGAFIFLVLYTCETKRTNDLTQKALRFQHDAIAAEMTIGEWDFVNPVVPDKPIGIRATVNNIGHSPAFYGFAGTAFRWTDLPNAFPLIVPDTNSVLEPTIPSTQSIFDETSASEEFIYSIPHLNELRSNPTTHHLEPPLPRTSVFFVGRIVYESLGVRTETEFCFFMVYRSNDAYNASLTGPKTDNRFLFISCPKWNQTTKESIY